MEACPFWALLSCTQCCLYLFSMKSFMYGILFLHLFLSFRKTDWTNYHGPLTRYVKLQVAHAPGMPGTFSYAADFNGNRYLATPACITARAWRTCRDACRDRLHAVTGKTFPAFPAHAHPQFCVSGKRPMDPMSELHTKPRIISGTTPSLATDSPRGVWMNRLPPVNWSTFRFRFLKDNWCLTLVWWTGNSYWFLAFIYVFILPKFCLLCFLWND